MRSVYAKGKHNTVYITNHKNGTFTLTDDRSDEKEFFDLDYIARVGKDIAAAVRHAAACFIDMDYLFPVEDYDTDGLYGA